MSQYDKNTFLSIWTDASAGKPFQTNTTRAIVSSIMRQFAQDIADSFITGLNAPNVDVYSFESFDWLWDGLTTQMGWSALATGTGSSVGYSVYGLNTTEKAIGAVECNTGSTAAGRATLSKGSGTVLLTIGLAFRFRVRSAVAVLSNGTDRHTSSIGYGDTPTASGSQVNGAYFRYTDNVNGGKWQAVCSSASTETVVDTGVAANTQYSVFDISVNAGGTVITFQIDNNAPVTISTNIPIVAVGLVHRVEKFVGTANAKLAQDWFSHLISSTTAR